jgi:putative NADH-flavin reductase
MKLTIAAATGGIGRHLVDQALAAGHDVTAIARAPEKLDRPVRAVRADLASPDQATLVTAIEGADAVLSGLGPRTRKDAGIAAPGTRALAAAMRTAGVRRIVVVSAAPTGAVRTGRADPGDGLVMRYLLSPGIRLVLREHYADLALMEDELQASGLDWTSVRPPRLTDGPMTGRYRLAYGRNIRGGVRISRADVAHAMLHTINDDQAITAAIGVAY